MTDIRPCPTCGAPMQVQHRHLGVTIAGVTIEDLCVGSLLHCAVCGHTLVNPLAKKSINRTAAKLVLARSTLKEWDHSKNGELMCFARHAAGVSRAAVAEAFACSEAFIERIESGACAVQQVVRLAMHALITMVETVEEAEADGVDETGAEHCKPAAGGMLN